MTVIKGFEIDQLVLNRAPQPFNENVVITPSSSVHRDLYLSLLKRLCEGVRRELSTLKIVGF